MPVFAEDVTRLAHVKQRCDCPVKPCTAIHALHARRTSRPGRRRLLLRAHVLDGVVDAPTAFWG
eukprot:3164765-Pyramimonas_sp.AAC.1